MAMTFEISHTHTVLLSCGRPQWNREEPPPFVVTIRGEGILVTTRFGVGPHVTTRGIVQTPHRTGHNNHTVMSEWSACWVREGHE